MLITQTDMQLPPQGFLNALAWKGHQGPASASPATGRDNSHQPQAGPAHSQGWHQGLWDHICLTKCEELRPKEEKVKYSWPLSQKEPCSQKSPRFGTCCCSLPRSKPSGTPQLQKHQGRIAASTTSNGPNPENLISFTFFSQDTALYVLERALKST